MALMINGWRVMAHPLVVDQLAKLVAAAQAAKSSDGDVACQNANVKLLAALSKLMFEAIPSDPLNAQYRQGHTLGRRNTAWFRAKFGVGRFRRFFRCSKGHSTILFAWVNDENTLRTYGSKQDAYTRIPQVEL